MERRFDGKVALVTGETTGIGHPSASRGIGRPSPEKLPATIAFLLTDDASYVTSATLLVDGGFIVNTEL